MKKKKHIRTALRFLEAAGIEDLKAPLLRMRGFDDIIIENNDNIELCEENAVRISTAIGVVELHGEGLSLGQLGPDDIAVHGRIDSISFIRRG